MVNKFVLAKKNLDRLEDVQGTSLSFWKDVFITFKKNKSAMLGIVVVLLILVLSIVGPYIGAYGVDGASGTKQKASYGYVPPRVPVLKSIGIMDGKETSTDANGIKSTTDDYKTKKVPDDVDFYFGTDQFGRDMWVRVWLGTRISLIVGIFAALIDITLGVLIGGISGYYGGRVDDYLQRVIQILASIPFLIVVILFLLKFGGGILPIILALGLTSWVGMSRLVRGKILSLKEQEFIYASKTLGASDVRIIWRHLIPNASPIIIVSLMFSIPSAIFSEAFLSFLGLGVQIPQASLGSLINDARTQFASNGYLLFYPALILVLLLLAFNMIGDGLRDAFDPKTRGGGR